MYTPKRRQGSRWERVVDWFALKLFKVEGYSFHRKYRILMTKPWPRSISPAYFLREENRRRNKAMIVFFTVWALGVLFGLLLGAVKTKHEPIKSPVLIETVGAAVLPQLPYATLPQANDRPTPKVKTGMVREVTAYNSLASQTDSTPCISADGSNICEMWQDGRQVCAANFVPFGTILVIDSWGNCEVRDRLSQRYPERVDVYMGYDHDAAVQFGIRNLNVWVKEI